MGDVQPAVLHVTGAIDGTPLDVREPAPGSLEAIYEKIGRTEEMQQAPRAKTPTPRSTAAPDLTDAEIIEKCQSADNAAKFNALWRGDISGYGSHSEADLALIGILKFYTRDPAQLERLVRQSGLYREKWDRTDYVTRTISKALEHVGETWSPGGGMDTLPPEARYLKRIEYRRKMQAARREAVRA